MRAGSGIAGLVLLGALALVPSAALPSSADQEQPVTEAQAPSPTVLVVAGRPVTRAAYEDWLVRERGEVMAPLFARAFAVERAARAEGLLPAPEVVRQAVEQEFRDRVENAFRGRREKWIEELGTAERSERGRFVERSIEVETDLAIEALARARATTRKALEQHFGTLSVVLEATGGEQADEPILSVDGEPVTRGAYGRWLRLYRGEVEARRFAEWQTLVVAAEAAGVRVDDEQAAARARADTEAFVDSFYDGDRDLWLRMLAKERKSEADHYRQATSLARTQLLLEGIVRARRMAAASDTTEPQAPPTELLVTADPVTPDEVAALRFELLRDLSFQVLPAMFD